MTLQPVIEILREKLGLDPDSLGLKTVPQIVAGRQQVLGLTSGKDYAALLRRSTEECEILLDSLVVSETWFFRGGELFPYLAERIRKLASSRSKGQPVRVLSAPCSTGEEPYSLVMALDELGIPQSSYQIEACDINERHLARARRAHYGELAFRQTTAERRARYFRTTGPGQWELDPQVRAGVRFRQANLVSPDFLQGDAPYDIVLCRNVMIYLHDAARHQVIAAIDRLLAPAGLIGMGPAEPLGALDRRFMCLGPDGYFLYCRSAAAAAVSKELGITAPHQAASPGILESIATSVPVMPPRSATSSPRHDNPRPPRTRLPARAKGSTSSSVSEDLRATGPEDLCSAARRFADQGALEAAWEACQSLLTTAEPTADVYALMGLIQQARHEIIESKRSFEKALYLDPQHSEALLHLMLLCEQQGAHDQARVLRQRLERAGSRGAK